MVSSPSPDASGARSIPADPSSHGPSGFAGEPGTPRRREARSQAGAREQARSDAFRRLTPLREMQLIESHRAGAAAALGELLGAYQRRVYSVCYRMLGNVEEASDLTQDALIRVIEGLHTYDERAAFSTWVIRVAMNCCLSHLRRERVRRHGSLDEPVVPGGSSRGEALPATGELSSAERIELGERRAALLRALARLDPPMRAVLVLRDLQDLDYQQIGEALEIPVGTVKSRLFRARAALRAAAEVEPGDELSGDPGDGRGDE